MIIVREIEPGTFAEVTTYEVIDSLDGDRRAHLALIVGMPEAERAAFGVYLVEPALAPAGKIVTAARFVRSGDSVVQELDLADPLPVGLRALVEARAEQAFAAGFAPTNPAFAGERLQVRDVGDRTNWLTSQAAYAAAVAGGFGNVIDATFRTAANTTVTVSYAEGLQTLLAMAAWGRAIFARSWALKDAIAAGEPYDLEAGWPA